MPRIEMIAISGGPCAGKTTGMERLKKNLARLGWHVLVIPETATELIGQGISPLTCSSKVEYQSLQFRLQLTKEQVYLRAARGMGHEKVLILCDRGLLDNKAYMPDVDFYHLIEEEGFTEDELLLRYLAAYHLTTAAKGTDAYSTENNAARSETREEAIQLDDNAFEAWRSHPRHRVIDNEAPTFDDKIDQLIRAVVADLAREEAL